MHDCLAVEVSHRVKAVQPNDNSRQKLINKKKAIAQRARPLTCAALFF